VIARRFLVSGRVQGVGYRFFAVSEAEANSLVGWVRNLPDGRVEALAEGGEAAMARFGEALRRGPRHAGVEEVAETDETPSGTFTRFGIVDSRRE